MLTPVVIVPSTPILVPSLVGTITNELTLLRNAVLTAAKSLPSRWLVISANKNQCMLGAHKSGTFAGYGSDIIVTLSPKAKSKPVKLPLCALIAGWIRDKVNPKAFLEINCYSSSYCEDIALSIGNMLRSRINYLGSSIGVIVVADGLTTLSLDAPGGYIPDSVKIQNKLDGALSCGDLASLISLSSSVYCRVVFQVLAGLSWPAPSQVHELYRGAPYGVGYFVGKWEL